MKKTYEMCLMPHCLKNTTGKSEYVYCNEHFNINKEPNYFQSFGYIPNKPIKAPKQAPTNKYTTCPIYRSNIPSNQTIEVCLQCELIAKLLASAITEKTTKQVLKMYFDLGEKYGNKNI